MISVNFVIIYFCLLGLIALRSCSSCNPCLPEPTSDTTPPSASCQVFYYEDGDSKDVILSKDSPRTVINTDAGREVSLIYTTQDEQGVKSLNISAVYTITVGGIGQRQDMEFAPITSSCPRQTLIGNTSFEYSSGTLSFSIMSENWVGLNSTSERHSIKFGD